MGFATDAVHAGQKAEAATGAVITPLFLTSTYAQEGPGEHKGYEYGRTQNPTREALEKNIATLESAKYGFAFSSGMSAISTVGQLLKKGDHIIATENVYGGTFRYFTRVMQQFGLDSSWVDTSDVENIRQALRPETRLIFVETPTNPMLKLSDISAIARFCKDHNLLFAVDNTFLTPYLQRPLLLGADIVVHSTTKYLNGHSDVIGGILLTNRDDLAERFAFLQNAVGAVPSPFDCWLVLRATKTLALRMEAHSRNALEIANFLRGQHGIKEIIYPGLLSHPQYELAQIQHRSPYETALSGGMISFILRDFETARRCLKRFQLFQLAESLGGVESLVCHPASMTHASVPPEMRQKIGLSDGLIRLSVGIEDVGDLIADLQYALAC